MKKSDWKLLGFMGVFFVIFAGFFMLLNYLQQQPHPITLNSAEWKCTQSHTEPVGMAMTSVCDQYTRIQ